MAFMHFICIIEQENSACTANPPSACLKVSLLLQRCIRSEYTGMAVCSQLQ